MTNNPLDRFLSKQTVRTLDGEKLYTFRLLQKKEAARIYHETVSVILTAIARAAGGKGPTAKLEAIRALDFDTFWGLASTLLASCAIRPDPGNPEYIIQVKALDDCEYFDDKREELYIATYYALKANYPKSLGRVETVLKDFGPRLEAMIMTSAIASSPDSSRPATSPDSLASTPKKSKKSGRTHSS